MVKKYIGLWAIVLLCFCPLQGFAKDLSPQDRAFEALTTKEWAQRSSTDASVRDGDKIKDHIADIGPKIQANRLLAYEDFIKDLENIDASLLSETNQINYEVFKFQLKTIISELRFKDYQKPLNSDSAFWSELGSGLDYGFTNQKDYESYLKWLGDVAPYIDQNINHMRDGLKRGFTPPQITLLGRDVSIRRVSDLNDVTQSGFYKPFLVIPETIKADEKTRLMSDAKKIIREQIKPAYGRLLVFFTQDYVKSANKNLAANRLPDGEAYYASKVFEYTTTDLTPEAIHVIGLREVKKIREEMAQTIKTTGFEGSFPEFLTFLRTDPQFYAKTPKELLYRSAYVAKQVDGVIGNYFKTLPRQRFAIKPVADAIAPYYTSGRGGAGIYMVNTYNLPARPLYSMPALTLHESAPGHAFQMSLSLESANLPPYRANTYISAYGEGWALYTERLGVEMGVYETPYEHFGMLSYQMWRAARLVVDTGIHTKGWTRDQALDFMRENTALSEHEITTEIDRYISWPAQALSYYIGQLEIQDLRKMAQDQLKDKFDIKEFHDIILSTGSVPLPVLRARVNVYIEAHSKNQ